jgi:hypothetical protein
MKKAWVIACSAAGLLMAGPAFASEWITEEPNQHLNQVETEFHAILGYGDVGAGFRVDLPILKQGFSPSLNDNVALSLGADILNWPSPDYQVTGMIIPVMLQWNFFLTRRWSLFGEGGVAFQDWFTHRANGDDKTFFVWPGLGAGARYYFKEGNYPALVLRVGYPSGLSVGISF